MLFMMLFLHRTLDALAVYGERALVDYDFSKASYSFLSADFLVIGKVEDMIRLYSRKNS
jgi:hypothetical protein